MFIAYERNELGVYSDIRLWVEELPKVGRSSFCLEEAVERFSHMTSAGLANALDRLSRSGKICSVWRGVYALVLPEYGLSGSIPPVEYIDQLMNYVGAEYYVGLLTAASFQGASHQSPQVFQVVVNKQLRSKEVAGARLEFAFKKNMSACGIEQKAVKSGSINVSVPAVTALDLVSYLSRAGGISSAATVLAELADFVDFRAIDASCLDHEPRASIQRLGFILDRALGEADLAQELFEKCEQTGIRFSRTVLASGRPGKMLSFDSKWKVAVNYDLEVGAGVLS